MPPKKIVVFFFLKTAFGDGIKSDNPFHDSVWAALWERLKSLFPMHSRGKESFPCCGICLSDGFPGICQCSVG